jgi:Phage integrase family
MSRFRIQGLPTFHWHDLRHTFASRLVMAGVDIRTVQELMGHKTIQVTMRYAHLAPAHQLEAVQRLCNTGSARSRATDTRTDTTPFEVKHDGGETELSAVSPATYATMPGWRNRQTQRT